jgi:hypothetical protein
VVLQFHNEAYLTLHQRLDDVDEVGLLMDILQDEMVLNDMIDDYED